MATTYTLISSVTVGGGGTSTITLSSIPGTYTDLALLLCGRTTRASYVDDFVIKPNGATTNRSTIRLYGVSSSVGSDSHTDIRGMIPGNNATSNTFGNALIYIPNYAGSNNKSFSIDSVMENNSTDNFNALCASLWQNSSAITSLEIISGSSSNFMEYSTAYLYGISNA